jgi:hypothetical protein
VDVLVDLLELGLVDFTVELVTPTQRGQHEFYATLRRISHGDSTEATARAVEQLGELRQALPDETRTWQHQVRESELLRTQPR